MVEVGDVLVVSPVGWSFGNRVLGCCSYGGFDSSMEFPLQGLRLLMFLQVVSSIGWSFSDERFRLGAGGFGRLVLELMR